MSAVLEHIHNLINEAKADLAKLFGHADAEVAAAAKAGAAKLDEVKATVEADLPVVEHEAVADAEHVAVDAETEGLKPAEAEAVSDAAHLAGEAVHDAEAAVEATSAPAETAPAEPATAEAAPATEPAATETPAATA